VTNWQIINKYELADYQQVRTGRLSTSTNWQIINKYELADYQQGRTGRLSTSTNWQIINKYELADYQQVRTGRLSTSTVLYGVVYLVRLRDFYFSVFYLSKASSVRDYKCMASKSVL
jgi:hypothetical protein